MPRRGRGRSGRMCSLKTRPAHFPSHHAKNQALTSAFRYLKVGGAYRYLWRSDADGTQMAVGGVFLAIVTPERLVATEQFDDAWYPGAARVTTLFEAIGEVTSTTITILYESTAARDTARRSGMEHGMAAGFDRLEALLPAFTQSPTTSGAHHD